MCGPGKVGVVDLLLAVLPPLVAVVVRREGVHLPHALLLPGKIHFVRNKTPNPQLQKITASSSKRSQPAAAGGGGGGTSNPCASDASSAQEETLFVPYCLLGGWRKQEMQMDREVLTGGRPGDRF
jgi:hypothetical protein